MARGGGGVVGGPMGVGPGSGGGANVGVGGSGKIAGLYDLEETLGSGHFAVVKLARHVFTGEKVAVKVIDKTRLDEVSRAHLFQEVRCMKLVQHPNVVRLYEVIDTQTKLYLILELGDGGDLYDYILKHETGLDEALAREYFSQIVRAISYCHRLHVVHRDLKPENVVFFERLGVVKLTDFGFSNKFRPGEKLETSCGSLAYSAPEILLGDSYDAPAVDVWSLGVILYMLVVGRAPFHEANDSETLTMIMDCKFAVPPRVSPACAALIRSMLVRAPDERATLERIAADPWLRRGGPGGAPDEEEEAAVPLVSRQRLSDDDHALVVQRMVAGQIATKEQILDALDKNEYNHVTATYYLLAERKLRTERQRRPDALGVSDDKKAKVRPQERRDRLTVPTQPAVTGTLLSIPRTPGDVPPRTRKCSIVREEEDDEDGGGTRRGSRSEGRLNLALQERLPTNPPPLPPAAPTVDSQANLVSAISKVNIDDDNTRKRLGDPGLGSTAGWMSFGKKSNCSRPKSAIEQTSSPAPLSVPKIVKTPPFITKIEIGRSQLPDLCEDDISITALNEAATITIPIRSALSNQSSDDLAYPYKTMPPTFKSLKHTLDDGSIKSYKSTVSSDSPKSAGDSAVQQRRNKYHKTHSSCSSSDASDEDSENRKKRSSKLAATPTHKPLPQRRDSHDDSSDSQEQGATGGGGGTGNSSSNRVASGGGGNGDQGGGGGNNNQGGNLNNSGGGGLSRRHRGGRRACETRLRESQSLNRITEVQEATDALPSQPARAKGGFFHNTKFFGNGKKNAEKKDDKKYSKSVGEEKENHHKIVAEKHAFKKSKLFSRYFQVHKKLCFPRLPALPGLWGGGGGGTARQGRLYKAQSCGSIVRDKITSAGASSLLLVNELCKDKPIVADSHRARIKLLATEMAAPPESAVSPQQKFDALCQTHLLDPSKCCGMC